jgi:hypothetical protein
MFAFGINKMAVQIVLEDKNSDKIDYAQCHKGPSKRPQKISGHFGNIDPKNGLICIISYWQ